MNKIFVVVVILGFSLLAVGCQKQTGTSIDSGQSDVGEQSGAELGEPLASGDLADPEVEEIISLLEELVAEEATGDSSPTGAAQDQKANTPEDF